MLAAVAREYTETLLDILLEQVVLEGGETLLHNLHLMEVRLEEMELLILVAAVVAVQALLQ